MFRTKHTKMAFFTAGILCCAVLTGLVNSVKAGREDQTEPVAQDMNDRIIAATVKCVQAGMEPEVEEERHYASLFPSSDDRFFVVCKTPGGKESNLDRMMRAYGNGPAEKFETPKKQVQNPNSFEAKSKVTE